MEPLASVAIRNDSLISPYGGPLAVQEKSTDDNQDESRFELCDPRFHAIATIDKAVSQQLNCGQRGQVVLKSNSPTIGKWLYQSVRHWIETQLELAEELVAQS